MYSCNVLHCTALYCTALRCTALHCTALNCIALHCTVRVITVYCTALYLNGTALHWTALYYSYPVLHGTVLYCTVLYSVYFTLSHAIKNTANQRARKPLHILQYVIGCIHENSQRSSRPPNFPAESGAALPSWQAKQILVQTTKKSHSWLDFSLYTHSPEGSCLYWEKSSHSWEISRYTWKTLHN